MTEQHQRRSSATKLVRCPTHGIFYDSLAESGCTQCLEEQTGAGAGGSPGASPATSGAQERSRPYALIGIVVLTAAAGILWMNRPEKPQPVPTSEPTAEDQLMGGFPLIAERNIRPIDPQPYRGHIETLERILYNPGPSNFSTGDAISGAAYALGNHMMENAGGWQGQEHAKHVMSYAMQISGEADAGYTVANLRRTRERWEDVRSHVFTSADWLQASSEQLTAAQAPPEPVVDARMVRGLRDWADELEELIRWGRGRMDRYGEIGVDVAMRSREARELENQWIQFAQDWDNRLESANRMMPREPNYSRDHTSVVQAYQSLSFAVNELRLATHSGSDFSVPFRSEREMRLGGAQAQISEARRYLAELRR